MNASRVRWLSSLMRRNRDGLRARFSNNWSKPKWRTLAPQTGTAAPIVRHQEVQTDWTWPTRIEREVVERALSLDFLAEARNLSLVRANGLGKTMIAQNICHAAVLAGYSVLFRSAAALLEELQRQTPDGRRRKLRTYANTGLLCLDEVVSFR